MADEWLTVRLDPAVKARFAAYCAGAGSTPSTVIRDAILAQVGQPDADTLAPVVRQVDEPDDGSRVAVRIRLTETERDGVDRHVEHAGGSRAGWIVRAVRAALTHAPEFGAHELEVLGASNRELLAIGRNLNQIARRLNERQAEIVTAGMVEALSESIAAHVDVVHRAMRASRERWTLRRDPAPAPPSRPGAT